MQFGVFTCTAGAALCGAVDAALLVPVIIAVSSVLNAFIELGLLPQTLRANNATVAELERVALWWSGLTLIQRRMASAKELLVERTEAALVYEVASLSQKAVKLASKHDGDAPDDDDDRPQKSHEAHHRPG